MDWNQLTADVATDISIAHNVQKESTCFYELI